MPMGAAALAYDLHHSSRGRVTGKSDTAGLFSLGLSCRVAHCAGKRYTI